MEDALLISIHKNRDHTLACFKIRQEYVNDWLDVYFARHIAKEHHRIVKCWSASINLLYYTNLVAKCLNSRQYMSSTWVAFDSKLASLKAGSTRLFSTSPLDKPHISERSLNGQCTSVRDKSAHKHVDASPLISIGSAASASEPTHIKPNNLSSCLCYDCLLRFGKCVDPIDGLQAKNPIHTFAFVTVSSGLPNLWMGLNLSWF